MVVLLRLSTATITRLVWAAMVDAGSSAHVLPNAWPPPSRPSRATDWLLAGVVVVESVFVIPGVGPSSTRWRPGT